MKSFGVYCAQIHIVLGCRLDMVVDQFFTVKIDGSAEKIINSCIG